MADERLRALARTSDPRIFAESVFPSTFDRAAQDGFMEAKEAFTGLFADRAKYNAIMHSIGPVVYRDMRRPQAPGRY